VEDRVEEPKPLDVSPAAITLALLLTDEELDSFGKEGLDMEKSRGADTQVDPMSQASTGCCAMVSLAEYSRPMPRPPTGDRGWRA
jgi:hypothetical protein